MLRNSSGHWPSIQDYGQSSVLSHLNLKDNIPHNTCQIYVKPHSKNTQMTLKSHIFDKKALRQAHHFSWFLVSKAFPRRMHGGCHCCHSETVSFVVSLLSRDVPCECSISEGLAIVPLARHRFQTKRGQFNGCLHARLHENVQSDRKSKKPDGLILILSHQKFDVLESFVCS